jgi:alpha-galactosidase
MTVAMITASMMLSTFRAMADSLVANGLRDVGYVYINRDGGNPRPESGNFVSTYKPVADYIHAKGMKFGCYLQIAPSSDAEAQTLAKAVADAGVDYLKHDAWTTPSNDPSWKRTSDALLATGRPIVYSTNSCPDTNVVNMWRTGGDIDVEWSAVMGDFDANCGSLGFAGPGRWPDPDMLEIGCFLNTSPAFTPDEDRAHFSMWCMMASPLIAGYDFSQTNQYWKSTPQHHSQTVAIHANAEVIALDQDPLCKPGRRIKGQGAMEVWIKDLKDGTRAVAFFNRTGAAGNMSIPQVDLGWGSSAQIYVRDLWLHQSAAPFAGTFTKSVNTHAAEVYRMSPNPIAEPTEMLRKMDRSIAWLSSRGGTGRPRIRACRGRIS